MAADIQDRTRGEQSQADAVRHEILRHATELFSHYGFWKTNIGDIAERCGMSPGNLYRYFKNKQAIGLATVQAHFRAVETAMATELMMPEGTAEERIRQFLETGIRHLVEELERHPKIVELAEFLCEDPEGLEILGAHIAWKRERLAREIANGVADGELLSCDPEPTAGTILNALKPFWMPMTLAHWRDRSTIMPELREILDLMFRGLRVRA